jgi:hypothetical protein
MFMPISTTFGSIAKKKSQSLRGSSAQIKGLSIEGLSEKSKGKVKGKDKRDEAGSDDAASGTESGEGTNLLSTCEACYTDRRLAADDLR